MLAPAAIRRLIEPVEVADAVACCAPGGHLGHRQLSGDGRRLERPLSWAAPGRHLR